MSLAIGIVIPAWNEEAVVRRTLSSLLTQTGVAIDLVLVANGCSDQTACIAGQFVQPFRNAGHRLRVIELPTASKAAALNAGDLHLDTFPRAYIDADVFLSDDALRSVAAALQVEEPRLAAPAIRLTPQPTWLTHELAGLLERLPPFGDDVAGAGFYAVNAAARRRWGQFPDLSADDAYVVSCFAKHERVRVDGAYFVPRFPTPSNLMPTFTRWEIAMRQLSEQGVRPYRASRGAVFAKLVRLPRHWPAALILAGIKWLAKRAAMREAGCQSFIWHRADGVGQ